MLNVAKLVAQDKNIILKNIDIHTHLNGSTSITEMTQSYQNLENTNIEAVYTFNIPTEAVFLDIELELNGEKVKGVIQKKQQAAETYEDAIENSHSAMLLRQINPETFSVSIANILPGETVKIRYQYYQLHQWLGEQLRLQIPLTYAPRYGMEKHSGMALHELPTFAFNTQRGLSLKVTISGDMAHHGFSCPTHPISLDGHQDEKTISLLGGSQLMDRDFVLMINRGAAVQSEGVFTKDNFAENKYTALVTFSPNQIMNFQPASKTIKLVIDCSGSMAGQAIEQAKSALIETVSQIREIDFVHITLFGSEYHMPYIEPIRATRQNKQLLQGLITKISANMGGTEIEKALNASFSCQTPDGTIADMILITDGLIGNNQAVIELAKHSNHRIFTIGIGHAVSAHVVKNMAEITHAVCELVSPNQMVNDAIVRQFKRLYSPRARSAYIKWPAQAVDQTPDFLVQPYATDTIHVLASFNEKPEGIATLKILYENGEDHEYTAELHDLSLNQNKSGLALAHNSLSTELPRIHAAKKILTAKEEEATELALTYQLLSKYTSCVLVYERDSQQDLSMPELRTVSQQIGTSTSVTGGAIPGIVGAVLGACLMPAFCRMDMKMYIDSDGINSRNRSRSNFIYKLGLNLSDEILDKLIEIGITTEKKLLKCTVSMLEKAGIFEESEISLIMSEITALKNRALSK